MSRYERRIFHTIDFEATVREREAFGWVYVKQSSRSRTVRGNHVGGGMNTGGGFIAAGTTTYQTVSWNEVEMYRDTWHPSYADLVEQESRYFDAPEPRSGFGPRTERFLKWMRNQGVAYVPIALIASLQFVAPLENWVQRNTVGWSGDQLSLLALGCLPLYFVLVAASLLALDRIEAPANRRYERSKRLHNEIRADALQRAQRLLGGN